MVMISMPKGKLELPCLPTFSWNAADAALLQLTSLSNRAVTNIAEVSIGMCGSITDGEYAREKAQQTATKNMTYYHNNYIK